MGHIRGILKEFIVRKRLSLRVFITVLLISIFMLSSFVGNVCEVKADTEQVQTVQEDSNTIPVNIDDIENMSLTNKLLMLILLIQCVSLGAFVGYVVIDRLR